MAVQIQKMRQNALCFHALEVKSVKKLTGSRFGPLLAVQLPRNVRTRFKDFDMKRVKDSGHFWKLYMAKVSKQFVFKIWKSKVLKTAMFGPLLAVQFLQRSIEC